MGDDVDQPAVEENASGRRAVIGGDGAAGELQREAERIGPGEQVAPLCHLFADQRAAHLRHHLFAASFEFGEQSGFAAAGAARQDEPLRLSQG